MGNSNFAMAFLLQPTKIASVLMVLTMCILAGITSAQKTSAHPRAHQAKPTTCSKAAGTTCSKAAGATLTGYKATGVQDYLSQGLQEKKYEATGLQVVTPTGVQEAQSTTEDPTTEATTKDTLEDLWKTENSNIDDLLRENTQLLKEATEETSSSNPAAPTKLLQFLVKDADEGMVAERAASIKSLAGLSAWPASVPASD